MTSTSLHSIPHLSPNSSNPPSSGRGRGWAALCLSFLLCSVMAVAGTPFTIVLDAGHGGKDPGALGKRGSEKNINLSVALAVGRLVEQNMPAIKVIYTRKTDVFVELNERAAIANRAKADLFVSIHTNAVAGNAAARGSETYTLGMHRAADNLAVAQRENEVIMLENDYEQRYEGFDPREAESYIIFELIQDVNMAQSARLATMVQRQLLSAGRPDKGVHQAGFLVLRATSMPSCLVELGYITTPTEESYLLSDAGVSQLAQGIYQAIKSYYESQQ